MDLEKENKILKEKLTNIQKQPKNFEVFKEIQS